MSHEHYHPDEDKRWVCTVTRCLIPEVAPPPPPVPVVRELTIPELFERLADAQARVVELEAAVVAHRPLCPKCRALVALVDAARDTM